MNSNESAQEAAHGDLAHIRKIMDSQARLLAFSGYSTVGIALFWLAALLFPARRLDERLGAAPHDLTFVLDFLKPELIGLGVVFVLCLAVSVFFTFREAKMRYETLFNRGGQNLALGIGLFLVAGFGFCLALLPVNAMLTAAAILVLYGLMLVHVSKYSRHDILPLGLGCITTGLFCAWTGKAWLALLVGFGIMHLIHGAWVELRKKR